MEQYNVTGMSCAACQTRVEKAVSKVPGVTSCAVSLLTNSMGVEGTASRQRLLPPWKMQATVHRKRREGKHITVGFHSRIRRDAERQGNTGHETPSVELRSSFDSAHVFLHGPYDVGMAAAEILEGNHIAMGLVQLLLTIAVMVINQKFFISGFKSLWHKAPNMDTLVALGSTASFVYSVYALFAMTGAQVQGDMDAVMSYMHEFYFESAAMILTLITVGKMLESISKGKTTDALKSLMKLAPKTAVLLRDGKEVEVGIDQVKKGDHFIVRPGENIPVDGVVLEERVPSTNPR